MIILIAAYDNALQTSIFNYLKNEAYVCETALNFQETSEKLHSYEYDLIILDFSSSKEMGLDPSIRTQEKTRIFCIHNNFRQLIFIREDICF